MPEHRVHSIGGAGARTVAAGVALGLAWLAVSPAARAEEVRRVGVVVALTVNATDERALALSESLGAALSSELAIEVIAGAEAAAALPAGGLPDGCIADDACVRDVGERLAVDEILALVVVEMGDRTQIEPTWLDVDAGRSVSRAAMDLSEGDDPAALFRDRAPELVPGAERRDHGGTGSARADADGAEDAKLAPAEAQGDHRRRMTPGAWTAAGVGVAALAAGTGFGLATRSLYRGCADGGCEGSDEGRIRRRALVADAALATAVVSGGVAALLYWWSDGAGPERAVSVGPTAGGVGVSLGGRF